MRIFQPPPLNKQIREELERVAGWLKKSDAPLYLEIGCGAGLHPIQFAKKNPAFRLLAFERTQEKFQKAEQRHRNNGAPANILLVHGDAAFFIHELFVSGPNRLDGVFILYPNPYPKKSQANLRWAHMPLTLALAESMNSEAYLMIASNITTYIEECANLIPQTSPLQISLRRTIAGDEIPRTHFEKKYLARGETCTEIVFKKSGL